MPPLLRVHVVVYGRPPDSSSRAHRTAAAGRLVHARYPQEGQPRALYPLPRPSLLVTGPINCASNFDRLVSIVVNDDDASRTRKRAGHMKVVRNSTVRVVAIDKNGIARLKILWTDI